MPDTTWKFNPGKKGNKSYIATNNIYLVHWKMYHKLLAEVDSRMLCFHSLYTSEYSGFVFYIFFIGKKYIYKNNLHSLYTVSPFCHASWTQFLIQIKTFPCLSLSVFHCLGILAFLSLHNILGYTVICYLYIEGMGHVPPHSAAVSQCWNRIPSKLPWDNSRYWKKSERSVCFCIPRAAANKTLPSAGHSCLWKARG